jgi:hypothetical protein
MEAKEPMSLVLEFMVLKGSPVIGMTGKQIEERYGINFDHAHEDYMKILDAEGNLDRSKYNKDKDYVVKEFEYVQVSGEYRKVSSFGVEASRVVGEKTCAV